MDELQFRRQKAEGSHSHVCHLPFATCKLFPEYYCLPIIEAMFGGMNLNKEIGFLIDKPEKTSRRLRNPISNHFLALLNSPPLPILRMIG
ncbi:MAG: hypothetical protein H6667_07300 [Ardenticatenaceae bacterium]|nr:hypothetical protein [Ardenticatenaceae bacterium]MCB9444115.1 hypothetical protein [Ardenticatenaceae bacterium]